MLSLYTFIPFTFFPFFVSFKFLFLVFCFLFYDIHLVISWGIQNWSNPFPFHLFKTKLQPSPILCCCFFFLLPFRPSPFTLYRSSPFSSLAITFHKPLLWVLVLDTIPTHLVIISDYFLPSWSNLFFNIVSSQEKQQYRTSIPVEDTRGQNQQITILQLDPNTSHH